MKASVGALVTGDPEHDDTFCGAVNSKQHYEKVSALYVTRLRMLQVGAGRRKCKEASEIHKFSTGMLLQNVFR